MSSVAHSPPEQGQLVSVRSRQRVVNDVRPSTLPPPALKPAFGGPQHLLTLASVEDDGLGEELQVIWEIEPGARVIEKVALPEPTGFDPPDKLDAFLDAVRWGAASTAAYLLAAPAVPEEAREVGQFEELFHRDYSTGIIFWTPRLRSGSLKGGSADRV
jgi:hypothetical protein